MKMKNMLIGGMSLVLVACVSIGGTLAYLTATSDEVENTFVGSKGITMTLDEAKVDPATGEEIVGEGAGRVKTNSYTDIIPGKAVDKDPTVHLTEIPTGGADLYVRVSGVDSEAYEADVTIDSHWTKVGDFEGVDGLYKYNGVVTSTGDYIVFDGVTFDYDQEGNATPTISPITVKAYAIQTGVSNADELAATALDYPVPLD